MHENLLLKALLASSLNTLSTTLSTSSINSTEVLVAIAVIELLDLRVAQLGNLFGSGKLHLDPSIANPFTVIAIFGTINAFDMLDGIDGLLASLAITTLVLFH